MPPPAAPAILETALYADDLDAARAFYGEVLDLPILLEKPGRHVFFRLPGSVLLIFRAAATETAAPGDPVPTHGARGPGHLCFAADGAALDTWEAHLTAQGITIEARITWPNGARSIYCRDPAGNSVEFGERALWGL